MSRIVTLTHTAKSKRFSAQCCAGRATVSKVSDCHNAIKTGQHGQLTLTELVKLPIVVIYACASLTQGVPGMLFHDLR